MGTNMGESVLTHTISYSTSRYIECSNKNEIFLIFVFMETTSVDIQPLYIFSCIFILELITYYLYIYTT